MASMAGTQAAPMAVQATKSASLSTKKPEMDDDESEWEYEYSTTETETFYVTLDISKADFISRKQAPVLKRTPRAEYDGVHADTAEAPDGSHDEGEEKDMQSALLSGRAKDAGTLSDDEPDEVQILDLHTANPLISYKGRLFEGNWSENVGTELLLTHRDRDDPLPAIRDMGSDIDLLAASSARITTTEREVHDKAKVKRRQRRVMFDEDDYEISEDEVLQSKDVPQAEPGASDARIEQGKFLANLIALKRKKGETDDVTVVAISQDTREKHQKGARGRSGPRPRIGRPPKTSRGHIGRPRGPSGSRRVRGDARASGHARASPLVETTSTTHAEESTTPMQWSSLQGQPEASGIIDGADKNKGNGGGDDAMDVASG